MARKTRAPRKTRIEPVRNYCFFCRAKKEPDYKEYEDLGGFLTDRSKIMGKKYSGLCSRHQRKLSSAIKRARYLGLMPYTPQL